MMHDKRNSDLLYPALQKFYSAISSLERFKKSGNFFDNISCLDTFFAEFKGIIDNTKFTLQNTPYKDFFKEKEGEIHEKFGWFHKTRDGVIHREPFPLKKQINITVYFPSGCVPVVKKTFTIDNDVGFSVLLDQLHAFFFKIDPIEVLFSTKYTFFQGSQQEDLFEKILGGVYEMLSFLSKLKENIPCNSPICDELFAKIKKSLFLHIPKDMLLIDDYVYYPNKKEFEAVQRGAALIGVSGKILTKTPLANLKASPFGKFGNSDFDRFVFMHAIIQSTEIMPALMIVYADRTYDLDAFFATNKTTGYRKINEIAERILQEPIEEVYYEQIFLSIDQFDGIEFSTGKERQKHATEEWLICMKVDSNLNEEEYAFYGPGLKCNGYIAQQMKTGNTHKLIYGINNMQPIIAAFQKKKQLQNQGEQQP